MISNNSFSPKKLNQTKIKYRPEVDGLRAIAIVAVIIYHAQITIFSKQILKGGFIGVDIFFVISGYLITSFILKELFITKSFSFKNFYQRRIRRILPALLFVMLVSLPFAWIYLLPNSFIDFSKSILYSLGFSSNFYFHYTGQAYGTESSLLKPFLHTWSLSIEEQYYFLFPIVILIIFQNYKKHLVTILVIILITSLLIANYGSKYYISATFYFSHTRIWEFITGSILAYFEITRGQRSKNQILNLILPSVGFFLIIYSLLFFDDKMFHPSLNTLPPIIGVCLIIWFSNQEELITKILSQKFVVGIGLISYSLYLWHYPVFAFDMISEFSEKNLLKKMIVGIIILSLSILTYFFIERPFRNKKNKFNFIFILILMSITILIFCNLKVIQNKGYKNRFSEIITKDLSSWKLLKNESGETCHDQIFICKFNTQSNKKFHLIGDSIMSSLALDLKNKIVKKNYEFATSQIGGCIFYLGFEKIEIATQKKLQKCDNDYFKEIKNYLIKKNNSIIVFGGRFDSDITGYYFDNKEGGIKGGKVPYSYRSVGKYLTITDSFKSEILELSRNNNIILIYPIPEAGWHIPKELNKLIKKLPKEVNKKIIKETDYITTSYDVYLQRTKSTFEFLDSIQSKNIHRIYPHKVFCDILIKKRCLTHDDKNTFYADSHHLSMSGAEMVNNLILKKIDEIELSNKNILNNKEK